MTLAVATASGAVNYPLLAGLVLVGSLVPVVPTGAVVSAAAALAVREGNAPLALVVVAAAAAAWAGDTVSFALARAGGTRLLARVTARRPAAVEAAHRRLERHGALFLVLGRLVPVGRVPLLAAAGALRYPWRRFVPAGGAAAALWATAYAGLGAAGGLSFASPWSAAGVVAAMALAVEVVMHAVSRRRARAEAAQATPPPVRPALRLLSVWLAASLAAALVASALPTLRLGSWLDALLVGAALAVVNAVVWPALVRVVLGFTVVTLGAGAFVLYVALVIAVLNGLHGVRVADDATAIVTAVVLAAVTSALSGLLDIDGDEVFQRRAARRARRRHGAGSNVPAVLFVQVDGLGYDVLRRAMRDGNMPTLAAWVASGTHRITAWETDWSSQTAASQCAILHGSNDDVPAFRWYEKDARRLVVCNHRGDAAEVERRHSDGRGLLHADGASHGNLFTGDAARTVMTMSVAGRRRGRLGTGYYGYMANPNNAARTLFATLADLARELTAAAAQRRDGVRPRVARGGLYPLLRAFTTVIERDVVVSAVLDDMMAGRSVIYADLLGYDEVAHHSGTERHDALAVLRGIDRQIGRLARAARLAPRPYRLVVLSDHGQSQGPTFADRYGVSLEDLARTSCGLAPCERGGSEAARSGGEGRSDPKRVRAEACAAAEGLLVLASGNLGMVYLTADPMRLTREQIDAQYPHLLPALVAHPGIGFVLVRSSAEGPLVLGRQGTLRLATGEVRGLDPLAPFGPLARWRVQRADGFAHVADVVVNSAYNEQTDEVTAFERVLGSHGGMGGSQSRPFLLYPADLSAPAELLGTEGVHRVLRGWLVELGHLSYLGDEASRSARQPRDLRLSADTPRAFTVRSSTNH